MAHTANAQVGWPLVVPKSEQRLFAEKVVSLSGGIFRKMLAAGDVALRDGLTKVTAESSADAAGTSRLLALTSHIQHVIFANFATCSWLMKPWRMAQRSGCFAAQLRPRGTMSSAQACV